MSYYATCELPARHSVGDDDFGAYGPIEVRLDGVEQRDVSAYDTIAGTIARAVRDGDGRLVLTPDGQGIQLETVSGVVTVRRADA